MVKVPSKGQVLVLCQVFYPELISTGMYMSELATALVEAGWGVDAICARPAVSQERKGPSVAKVLEYRGINVRRANSFGAHRGNVAKRLTFGLTFMLSTAVLAIWRARRYDGMIITTNPPFLGLVGLVVRWMRRRPYVVILHDVYPDTAISAGLLSRRSLISWLWERTTRMILRGANANIVIGRDMGKLVEAKLGGDRVNSLRLIPNWADARKVKPVPSLRNSFRKVHNPDNSFLVQYSGTIARIHNVEVLLDAAELLRGKPILFQFVGEGFKKEKLQKTARLNGLTNVQFLPFQPEEQLAEVLSAANLAVVCLDKCFTGSSVPSKTYGMMAAGVPILGLLEADSEIGLTIAETGCGVVLPDATGPKVAQAILELSQQPERLREMGERGYRAFKERFTLAKAAEEYDRVLTECFLKGAKSKDSAEPILETRR